MLTFFFVCYLWAIKNDFSNQETVFESNRKDIAFPWSFVVFMNKPILHQNFSHFRYARTVPRAMQTYRKQSQVIKNEWTYILKRFTWMQT